MWVDFEGLFIKIERIAALKVKEFDYLYKEDQGQLWEVILSDIFQNNHKMTFTTKEKAYEVYNKIKDQILETTTFLPKPLC